MHVIFYISRFGIGGIQTFVIQMAKELVKMPNVEVSIFCHHPELVDTSQNEAIPPEIEILTLSKNKYVVILVNKLRNWIKKIWKSFDLKEWLIKRYFFKVLKKTKGAIVHNNIQVGDNNVYQAQRYLNIPYITTLHGAYKEVLRENVSKVEMEKLKETLDKMLSTASSIVYLSEKNILPFRAVIPNRNFLEEQLFTRIYNGLAAQSRVSNYSKTDGKLVFGMIARGHKDKGWVELLDVFNQLILEGASSIELRLFADGNYVKDLMQTRDWHPNIKYMGATSSPLKEILSFDVGLLPSYHEEMPFTIIEYLACGKPSIATDVGAIASMLESGNNKWAGILIPLNDENKVSKKHLREALLAFINEPSLIDVYGNESQKAFEKFNIKNTVKKYYNLYQNALDK